VPSTSVTVPFGSVASQASLATVSTVTALMPRPTTNDAAARTNVSPKPTPTRCPALSRRHAALARPAPATQAPDTAPSGRTELVTRDHLGHGIDPLLPTVTISGLSLVVETMQ
jgi:hypothetical protein